MTAAFARETPKQRAKHAEIDARYRKAGRVEKLTPVVGQALRRRRELITAGAWFARHDPQWSPDQAAWATVIADALIFLGGNADDLRRHAHDAGVSIDTATARAAIAAAEREAPCRPMSGGRSGRLIGLTCEARLACRITTMQAIDETPEERKHRVADARRVRERLRKRRERAAKPKKPASAHATRPWLDLGISRATWYRRGKPGSPDFSPSQRETNRVRAPVVVPLGADGSVSPSADAAPTMPVKARPEEPRTSPAALVRGRQADVDAEASPSTPWPVDIASARWRAMTEAGQTAAYQRWDEALGEEGRRLALGLLVPGLATGPDRWDPDEHPNARYARLWLEARRSSSDPAVIADEALRMVALDARTAATRKRLAEVLPETMARWTAFRTRHKLR